MNPKPLPKMTPEEYLVFERASDKKHEYIAGQIYAMGGAKRNHNIIALSLGKELYQATEDKDCEAYAADMRIFLPSTEDYAYPDLTVVCGEPVFQDDVHDTLINPVLIAEILSDSTEAYDRGAKFSLYRSVKSLKEYILISQSQPRIEKYERQGDGFWMLSEAVGLESEITFNSIGLTILLNNLYKKIHFEKSEAPVIRPRS